MLTRVERVAFQVKLDSDQAKHFETEVETLVGNGFAKIVKEGDTLNINFKVIMEYFDHLDKKLQALLNMEEAIVSIDYDVLNQQRSLILEIGRKLEELSKKD